MIWTNHPNPGYKPGVPIWNYAADDNRELMKDRISRAAFLNEPQEFESDTSFGEHYRIWIWPLAANELRVCFVGLQMPEEIALLTARERECLERLAIGHSTAQIAAEFDVSVSTVHTYMKRAREKLHIPSMEHLIAFASRYLPPPGGFDALTRNDSTND
jgi:DNA-binding CsgD family transcriptional regulator